MDLALWKKRKKELRWTHDDLARESGVSRRTIARIFAGNPDSPSPTLNTIEAIERALGIGGPAPEWTDEVSDEEKNYLSLYRKLPPEGKDAVLRLMKSYLPSP